MPISYWFIRPDGQIATFAEVEEFIQKNMNITKSDDIMMYLEITLGYHDCITVLQKLLKENDTSDLARSIHLLCNNGWRSSCIRYG